VIHNLYLFVVVLLRVTATYLMLWGVYNTIFSTTVGLISMGLGQLGALPFVLLPIVCGLTLWAASKSIANGDARAGVLTQ